MEQSQFIELLKTLNPVEKEQILLFSTNSYFNNGRFRTHIIPLFEICLSHPWGSKDKNLNKKEVFALIFPKQAFVDGKLEKLMVEAHKLLRTFLLIQYYCREDNDFDQTLDFSEILRSRGLVDRHEQILTRLKKKQEGTLYKDSTFYFKQIKLETSVHYIESLNNQRKGDLNIPQLLGTIEGFYHSRRVALLNRYLLQQKVTTLDIPEVIQSNLEGWHVPQRYLTESASLQINYKIFSLLQKEQPELEDIQTLVNLLQLHEKNLDWENLQEFYTYLRNFCVMILMVDPDNGKVIYLLHDIYKDNLERRFMHYEGKIVPSRFMAIAENALKIKQFDWVHQFIELYKLEIYGENETQDIYRLNKAFYLFAIGKYSECLDHIPDTSPFNDYLLKGKRLELKALYELHSDLLSYKLDAFKMFISRTSSKLLSADLRRKNQDFANLMHQIIYTMAGDGTRAERVIKRIKEKKQAMEWHWLLDKAKTLKSTFSTLSIANQTNEI